MSDARTADHPVDALFTDRTSPRSFTGAAVKPEDLMSMLEAARWAPSSSNVQPWRFIYALRDTPEWGPIFEGIMPMNARWVDKAGALVVFVSDLHMMRGDQRIVSPWHSFDTGAAWLSLAQQAHMLGYATHAMGGFFADKLRVSLNVPEDFHIDTVVAIGTRGAPEALPDDLKAREVPTPRRKLSESLFHGVFAKG